MNTALFTELTICGLDELDYRNAEGVTHVLSILDPGWPEPAAFRAFGPHLRTTLRFHDVIERAPHVVLPQRAHIKAILAFGRDLGGDLSHLLIHCHAGISRSTAAMAMILAQAFPQESEEAIVDRLLLIRPQAWPNSRMVHIADELLGREGRLSASLSRIYAYQLAAHPELAETMRRLNRAKEVELGFRGNGEGGLKRRSSGSGCRLAFN
jgi:predicted protein tyrosine phosphatase